jgi:FkbM family methyltransferase
MRSARDRTVVVRSDAAPSAAAMTRRVMKYVWEHPANEGQRARALMRATQFQLRGRVLGKRTLARLGDRSRVWAYLHRTGASRVIYGNPPDYAEMMTWRRNLRPGDLFIDVGANVGSYSIWAAESGADVIALEPADETFGLLLENVALNGYRIDAIQAAAGSFCGTAHFTSGRDCVNQFDPLGDARTRVVTIDSLIGDRTVAGMKVDVEGFEIQVLQGCVRALAQERIGLIQLEWNAASEAAVGTDRLPVAEFLAHYRYRLFRPDSCGELLPVSEVGFGSDVFARPQHVGP